MATRCAYCRDTDSWLPTCWICKQPVCPDCAASLKLVLLVLMFFGMGKP
jgi:hypothetical protein